MVSGVIHSIRAARERMENGMENGSLADWGSDGRKVKPAAGLSAAADENPAVCYRPQ